MSRAEFAVRRAVGEEPRTPSNRIATTSPDTMTMPRAEERIHRRFALPRSTGELGARTAIVRRALTTANWRAAGRSPRRDSERERVRIPRSLVPSVRGMVVYTLTRNSTRSAFVRNACFDPVRELDGKVPTVPTEDGGQSESRELDCQQSAETLPLVAELVSHPADRQTV